MKLKHFIYAGISGVLLFLSFPNFLDLSFSSWTALPAWIALIPLFFALDKKSMVQSFIIGGFAGFVFFAGVLYWITNIKELGSFAVPAWILFSIYLSFFIGLYAMLQSRTTLFIAPFLWVALEYLRSTAFTGFPWALLGYSQYRMTSIIQVSSLGGVYLVSFIVVAFNAGVTSFFLNISGRGRAFSGLVLSFILIAGAYIFGAMELGSLSQTEIAAKANDPLKKADTFTATVLQGNIPQDVKWDAKYVDDTFKIYSDLAMSSERADLIVWPESASTVYLKFEKKYLDKVGRISQDLYTEQIVGTPDAVLGEENKINKAYVSAFHIGRMGQYLGSYNKIHLVPFGEYVPFKEFLKSFEAYTSGFSDYTPGTEFKVFKSKKDFSVLICFEAAFPELSREFAKNGAKILVNITNDAWYRKSAMPYQHFSMLVFRAIETRLPVVRAANTGVSGFIDVSGEITGTTGIFEKTKLTQTFRMLDLPQTPYTKYGDIFVYVCIGIAALGVMFVGNKGY